MPDRITCDSCELLAINGTVCHETGCPNAGARWDAEEGEWCPQAVCNECGSDYDRGTECCTDDSEPEGVETYTLPAGWASYLVNGDDSGLEPDELARVDAWLERHPGGSCVDCGEAYFSRYCDAPGELAGDMAEYTFISEAN